jgi:CheY-like chemotaxis protein
LEFHDFEVRVAGSGANALEMLSIWIPDLIVSDVMMPVMTGFELILKVRKIPGLVNIPVVFLSALAGDDERRKGLDLGAFDFITKPFRSADLVAILNEKLNFKN